MECPTCNKLYSRRDAMLRHYRNKHGSGLPPPPPPSPSTPTPPSPPPPPPQPPPPTPQRHDRFNFKHPFTMMVSGPTSCGKTYFLKEVLRRARTTIDPIPNRIVVWLYKLWQPLYDEIRKTVMPKVLFVRGIPSDLDSDHYFDARTRNMVILDHLMSTTTKDPRINDLFTEDSHHRNLSVVFINQNLYFLNDPTQRRNCHYLVLLNNPVDRQSIATLGRQMYPNKRDYLMRAFEEATRKPHGYLLVDLKSNTSEYSRLRSDVFNAWDMDTSSDDWKVEELEDSDFEYDDDEPDQMACAACGLVFAHERGLNAHQERGCEDDLSVNDRRAVKGTYGYELERYLEDLPASVMCADDLPAEVADRPRSFIVKTDDCEGKGEHWVAFHFPSEGPAEFFDTFGRVPELYHRHFRNVLIVNGPQYKFNTVRVQPEDGYSCGLYCVHFVRYRHRHFTMEDIVNELTARDPKQIKTELKDVYQ